MKYLVFIIFLSVLSIARVSAQNYLVNGDFEYGLTANWEHQLSAGALASFTIDQSRNRMEGSVGLKVHVDKLGAGDKGIQSSTNLTLGADSIHLLRFWAKGTERSKIYVEVDGSQTPGVLYEMHQGRTLFHLPFKSTQKNLQIHFYFMDGGVTYSLDGVEVLDQNNEEGIDVLNTYIWQHNRKGQGWTAGDNDVSILLPDGRTAWFFNDSFYGTNDVTNNPLYEVGSFIRNAMVIQELDASLTTRSFVDQNGQKAYFEVPDPIIGTNGKQKNFFWVGDAILEAETLKVYLVEVKEITGGAEATGNSYLGEFSYPELEFLGLEKQSAFCYSYETFFTDKDSIYLFKSEGVGIWEKYSHVARTQLGNLNGKQPWEYWNGTSWVDDQSESARINNMGGDGFMKLGEGSYAHVSMPNLGNQIQVSFAPKPEGPWTPKETVYTIPNDSAYWFYMPNFHMQLPNGNYSISYSVNAWYDLFFAFEAFVDKYWYRQRYIQVDLLGLSPYSAKKDCAGIMNGDAYLDDCEQCVGGTTELEPCVSGRAKLYTSCDFTGRIVGLDVGDYLFADLEAMGFSINDLSSVEIEAGYRVELFDEDEFSGNNLLLAESNNCIDEGVFNSTTSLLVRRKGTSDLSGIYAIQNKQSELFLGVKKQSIDNKALIEQAPYTDDDFHRFELKYIGNGYYKVINLASDLAFNIAKFSKEPHASIEQWDGLTLDITDLEGSISAQYNDSPVAEGAEKLIDKSNRTTFLTFQQRSWVQFHTETPQVVSRYSLTSANDKEERDPKNWSLLGSNDGETWVMLDTLSNIDFTTRIEEKTFNFENTSAYSYYRLDMECDQGTELQFADLKLIVVPEEGYNFDSQLFVVQESDDGYFRFINKNSDLVLQILDGEYNEGIYVKQMTDIGQPGALWKLLDPEDLSTNSLNAVARDHDSDLILYPNPVGAELNLKLDDGWFNSELSIMNIAGATVWSGRYENKQLYVDQLKMGFYIIQISNDNRMKVGSFIKR